MFLLAILYLNFKYAILVTQPKDCHPCMSRVLKNIVGSNATYPILLDIYHFVVAAVTLLNYFPSLLLELLPCMADLQLTGTHVERHEYELRSEPGNPRL